MNSVSSIEYPWKQVKWLTTPVPEQYPSYKPNWEGWKQDEHDELTNYKNQIDELEEKGIWEKRKKIVNPFELVYTQDDQNMPICLAKTKPLSRSYFKMVEMLKVSEFFKVNTRRIRSAHACEGPGGFIQALAELSAVERTPLISALAMTLRPTHSYIPGWRRAVPFLQKNKQVKIVYGEDNTGDIYNLENQAYFVDNLDEKVQIFTADGGFDYHNNYTDQEQTTFRLILASFVLGFKTLDVGGYMIIKLFDVFGQPTKELLYVASLLFKDWTLYKPAMSRPCNSERYFIGRGFKGYPEDLGKLFEELQVDLKTHSSADLATFLGQELPQAFSEQIKKFQVIGQELQIKTIKEALALTEESDPHLIWRDTYYNAEDWCKYFKVPYRDILIKRN
jgi:23S rRNA U2552 (ribose-2'-O)-methylase RlmE/FtsJ